MKLMAYIREQFKGIVSRVDMIFDVYKNDSLKAATRKMRGQGTRIRVEGQKKVPGNWAKFLRENGNKSELFQLISEKVTETTFPGQVVITCGQEVKCAQGTVTDGLSPSTHEEADTRMLLHAANGAREGYTRIMLRTVDTDVVVLAVSLANKLAFDNLWVAFGTGNNFRYLDASAIAQHLGDDKSAALPAFHALTGCDTTSSFAGRGKLVAWTTWNAFSDVTPSLCTLSHIPTKEEIAECLPTIERFIVQMYDRGSTASSVNEARQELFTQKGREIENLPPTQDALLQHLLRVGYQAGHVWGQALVQSPTLPNPADYGWMHATDGWQINWMTLPPAGMACRAIIKCGCTKGCKGKCKCVKEGLRCTTLCGCHGCDQVQDILQ